MNIKFQNIKRAFTLVEIIVALTVVAIVSSITVNSTVNSQSYKKQQLKAKTRVLYVDIEKSYQDILSQDTVGYNIANLVGVSDMANDGAARIRESFSRRMDLEDINCGRLPAIKGVTDSGIWACSKSKRGFYLAFNMYGVCNTSGAIGVKEYFEDGPDSERAITRAVSGACGRIVYIDRKQKRIDATQDLGTYYYIVALGRRGLL